MRRLERSWIGLSLDAIRLDEIASACYGLNLARWKVLAFTLGNFLAGTAGAAYGHVLGFIAPNNFTFGDSLILVSIILLGGHRQPVGRRGRRRLRRDPAGEIPGHPGIPASCSTPRW